MIRMLFLLIGIAVLLQVSAKLQWQQNYTSINTSKFQESLFQPKIIGGFPICLTDPQATYCELDRSYPLFVIGEILKNSPFYNDPSIYLDQREKGFENKVINVTEEDNGELSISTFSENALDSTCPFKEVLIYPPVAKSLQSSVWVYVVNNPDFKQGFKGEKCDKAVDVNCDNDMYSPSTYESKCVQKFRVARLLAVDPATRDTYEDSFNMPSHCECETNSQVFPEFLHP